MRSMELCERRFTIKEAPSLSGREIKRRRKGRRESENHIANDIVEEILIKLPVSSLSRFQFVSKHWRSLIKSKDFEERYNVHQKTKDPKLLFVCDDFYKRAENALCLRTMSLETMSASLEDKQCLEFVGFKGYLEISESCDGLVCIYGFTKAVEVMNAVTAMYEALPLAKFQRLCIDNPKLEQELYGGSTLVPAPGPGFAYTRLGFGKDNVTGRFKLVWLYNKYPATACLLGKKRTICEVLDLQDKKWRFVSTTPLDYHLNILTDQKPAFANGSFYWLTGDEEGYPTTETKLVVFNIHTEMFRVMSTPACITRDAYGDKIGICNLDGRLCVSELKADCKQEFWWRVQDKKNTWERIFSVDLCSTSTWFRGITSHPLTPLAIHNNKVILSLRDYDNLVAFDLDPHSKVYHLYFSGYYGLAVPFFPGLLLAL